MAARPSSGGPIQISKISTRTVAFRLRPLQPRSIRQTRDKLTFLRKEGKGARRESLPTGSPSAVEGWRQTHFHKSEWERRTEIEAKKKRGGQGFESRDKG